MVGWDFAVDIFVGEYSPSAASPRVDRAVGAVSGHGVGVAVRGRRGHFVHSRLVGVRPST